MTRPDGSLRARPTNYRGTLMRSRLEALWAASLDREGLPWEYEPLAFGGIGGQYLPDFEIFAPHLYEFGPIYLEVKPTSVDLEEAKRRMEIILESEPKALLLLWVGDPGAGPARWAYADGAGWTL